MSDTTWIGRFRGLEHLDPAARRRLLDGAREVSLPAGTVLFREGELCENFLLVTEGAVRVQKVSENGREIILYRVEPGESCILTTSCLISAERYTATGIVESNVRGVVIPHALFEQLLGASPDFRAFVFQSYATRLADLLVLIEEVAFGRIDARLAQTLLEKRSGQGVVAATHQDLAVELGTAREVVSRQLKEFERRNWVSLARGRVDVRDAAALRAITEKRTA